jgi:hypothetical protein
LATLFERASLVASGYLDCYSNRPLPIFLQYK